MESKPSSIDPRVTAWRKEGKHLPKFIRDFHDQKDLFKTIHELTIAPEEDGKQISWMEGQIYAIDTFLWFMARHGYTLQKTSKKLPFEDIEETVRTSTQIRDETSLNLLLSSFKKD